MALKERIVVITGAASGIGQAAALCCARAGAGVVIADIDEAGLQETEEALAAVGTKAITVKIDISRESDVQELIRTAVGAFGRIDGLINSAGVLEGPFVPLDSFEEITWDRVVDINLKGSFFAAKHAAAVMKQQGNGVIILISSGAGVTGGSSSVAYGSSKGGVHGLSLVLAGQLAPFGIRVHAVCPGGIATPLKLRVIAAEARLSGKPEEEVLQAASASLGDPEGVGKILAFMASHDADFLRGTVFTR